MRASASKRIFAPGQLKRERKGRKKRERREERKREKGRKRERSFWQCLHRY
jgi:hypothetical protein